MVSPKMNSEAVQEDARETVGMARVKGETPTPERPPSSASPGSAASEDTCSICLGHITEKCVTDSCLHSFCLLCLKEWAKQKAVCPLCKLSFTKIMYDIKTETDYKEWKVPPPEPPERGLGATYFQEFLDAERRRFFGYRTTPFPGASRLRLNDFRRTAAIPDAIPSLPPHRRARYSLRGSTMFRLSVYLNNIWVQPLPDITGRYRQTSPELYRDQPALTHRLVPWVNRELAALVPSSRVGVVLAEVMDLIERHPVNSREFQNAMQPHLGERTRHFMHEFYYFARSPYDMVGHDNAAQYVPRYGNEFVSDTSNSDDSDAVVEVDAIGNPVASTSSVDGSRGQTAPGNVVREEILTHGGSVVISSSDSSDSEVSQSHGANVDVSNFELNHNPECPPGVRRLIGRAVDFLASVNDGASTSRSEGHESTATRALSENKAARSNNDDSDGCMIIDEVVPRIPTPEIIELESDDKVSSTGIPDDGANTNLHRPRMRRKLRGKSKPTLKRTNFLKLPSSQNDSSGEDCRVAQQDHSYCNEDGASTYNLPSTSHKNPKRCVAKRSPMTEPCELSSDSDESETEKNQQCASSVGMSSSHQNTRTERSEVRKGYDRKRKTRGNLQVATADNPRKRRCSDESKASGLKDLKSKIKSSALQRDSRRQEEGAGASSCHNYSSVHIDNSSENSHSSWSQMVARNAENHKVCHSSDSTWVPTADRYDRNRGSTSRYGKLDFSSSSEESCSETKISRYSEKYRKSKKTSKKRKRKSKEKHKEKSKRSSKKKKHRRKSKSKKHCVPTYSDSESSKHKKIRKSGHRKTQEDQDSDSESSSSYLKYKKKTTVSVKKYRNRISSSSSDTYP